MFKAASILLSFLLCYLSAYSFNIENTIVRDSEVEAIIKDLGSNLKSLTLPGDKRRKNFIRV